MSNKQTCPTCGHLRETFTSKDGTSGFVPPVDSKPNDTGMTEEEIFDRDSKPNKESKEAWQIIERACKPYGGFVNVITNCGGSLVSMVWIKSMEDYAALKLSEANSEIARLQS